MELSALDTAQAHSEGAEMQVELPNGDKTDLYIRLAGVDSKLWRKLQKQKQRDMIAKAMAGDDAEIGDDDAAEILADATLGWRGAELNGEPVEFSLDAILALYKSAPYIADQADRFIGARANFTKG